MAGVIRREFHGVARTDHFTIIPIGDIHLGAKACDEAALKSVVDRVKREDNTFWLGLGDFCEFINMKDKRFSVDQLASWIDVGSMIDLAKAQKERFLDFLSPIANKCLALIQGNHESVIQRFYERDIYSEIVTGIKQAARYPAEERLGLGYTGWLRLVFYRGKKKAGASTIDINLHHGFVGGRLAGAKALNMQRWLWNHAADIVIFGHSHNTMAQVESVELLDRNNNIVIETRRGCYSGSFLRTGTQDSSSTYSERAGYFPLPLGGCEIQLKPCDKLARNRIRILT